MPDRRLIRRNLSPQPPKTHRSGWSLRPHSRRRRRRRTADIFSGTWSTIIEHFAKHMYTRTDANTHTHTYITLGTHSNALVTFTLIYVKPNKLSGPSLCQHTHIHTTSSQVRRRWSGRLQARDDKVHVKFDSISHIDNVDCVENR